MSKHQLIWFDGPDSGCDPEGAHAATSTTSTGNDVSPLPVGSLTIQTGHPIPLIRPSGQTPDERRGIGMAKRMSRLLVGGAVAVAATLGATALASADGVPADNSAAP
ncbi:hypothetical protein, partial [Streptomyces sp. CB02056]|uniref:hypothetical protein n=1 Tax=Streptomyces sp. CB02056 TaxID=1703924 RepID=UPI001160F319